MALPQPVLDKLREAMETRRLVAFHQWEDDPMIFLVGFVTRLDTDRIFFAEVGVSGRPDEDTEVAIDDLVWLDFDTEYLRGLEILHPVNEKLIGPKPAAGIKATNTQAIRKALVKACERSEVVTMKIDKESIEALVSAVDGDFFCYTPLEDGGRPNGMCWLRIEVVKQLILGTDREIASRFLYERRRDEGSDEAPQGV